MNKIINKFMATLALPFKSRVVLVAARNFAGYKNGIANAFMAVGASSMLMDNYCP